MISFSLKNEINSLECDIASFVKIIKKYIKFPKINKIT
jgi:hypothetical protein